VSDHADFTSLVSYAQRSGAREVITLHGFAEELAGSLRGLGMFARAVTEQVQMVLL
jgi:putative mRNA 3-end processing factor